MSLLTARGLSRRFGGLLAVDGVDLDLREGEILGVIGPNGAGKTTLFALLSGSLRPTAGRVALDGQDLTGLPAHRVARAGLVRTHQIVRPFANLTVLENVLVAARHHRRHGAAHATSRARAALERVGLGDRAGHLPGSLTLAGRKRLELARALALRPRVLLLDEVIAGVNPAEAQEMGQLIRRARDDRGVSIVMTEHVMPAVMSLSDHLCVLDAGRLIAEGKPEEIVRNPEVIAAYLGKAHAGAGARP
jgi:branched-chain amino acid transport system ATP-binding protein